ncbi:MAG: hypothetical protein WBB34_11930, partial [Xanthobacteraceae bacterium]
MTGSQPLLVLRTSQAFYWLVGGILGAAFTLGALVVTFRTSAGLPPTIILGCLMVAAMSVFLSAKLVLTDHSIHYRSQFATKDVALADIVAAKFNAGFRSFKPYQRLVLTVREQHGEKEITMNTG